MFLKGQDWYDLLWYIRKCTLPNLDLLQNALQQAGPFVDSDIVVNAEWLHQALLEKIQSLDWKEAIRDVEPFLNAVERRSLSVWGVRLFSERVQKLCERM
ncbi:MAG: hypothetical protein EOM24_10690 [Chloroflexia bacterium]|nr:hypothetical protein [Chloroflexia bacterium]